VGQLLCPVEIPSNKAKETEIDIILRRRRMTTEISDTSLCNARGESIR
jgi:hypothetical protein